MSSQIERKSRRELLILDTGPIRELVLFHAVHEFGFERLRRNLQVIKDREAYHRCGNFILSFKDKTTSASVVGELYCWIRNTEPKGQERLWKRVYEEFQGVGMNEEVVRLLDMDFGLVARLGPVDVSLQELTRRHADHHPVLLTIDSALQGECKKAGLDATLVQEVALMVR